MLKHYNPWGTRIGALRKVFKFCGQPRLIRSVWEHQKFPCKNCLKVLLCYFPRTCHVFARLFTSNTPWYFLDFTLWFYYTIPFGFSLFWHVWNISFQLLIILFWLRITVKGSVPEMQIWSILIIKSDWKWCINLRISLFLYFNYFVSVTASGPLSPLSTVAKFYGQPRLICSVYDHQKVSC